MRTFLLSLSLLTACAPAVEPTRVGVDSFYTSSVGNSPRTFDSTAGAWVHTTPAYTLSYRLGTHAEGVAPASIKLELENTGNEPIRIVWDESRFTYPTGTESRVLHSGVRTDATTVPATVVPPGSFVRDRAVPARSITLEGVRPILTLDRLGEESFKLLLALEVGNRQQPMTIHFDGTGATQSANVTTE